MPAIPLLAAFPEVGIAFAAILLLYAAGTLLAKPLTWVLQQIPVVGSAAAGYVGNALGSIAGYATGWAEGEVSALTQLISAPVAAVQRIVTTITDGIETTIGQVLNLGSVVASGLGAFGAMVAGAVAELGRTVSIVNLQGTALSLATIALATLQHITMPAAIASAVTGTEAWVRTQVAAAMTIVSTDVRKVEADVATAVAYGETSLRQAERDILGQVGAGVTALEGEIGQVRGLVNPLVAAGLLTLVPTLVKTLEDTMRECVTPTCSVVKPQIPTLTGLMDIGILALLGGVVGEAIANPVGAADVTAGVVGGIEGAARDLFGAFTGASI